eukprot:TRINITY_DN14379_c0_g1_i2.p1 TRINITY_DN14379_c0_g1~~TRINITY_DN14379_c0_g1_i2.p1  ORF type:complete len:214 (+),score=31.77 TRINITY_DN14379_c0_g1_i2:354-995(+)
MKQCRMICLSDATGSMASIWGSTRSYIKEMLRRIEEIGGDHFQMVWGAYRDYSDGGGLLEKSAWSSDPLVLQSFVDSISCHGGGDAEEAIEYALADVRAEHAHEPVTRVLLIGDAAPHFEVMGQRLTAHSHTLATDYRREAKLLAELGVPVYSFYTREHAREAFMHISATSGGEAAYLDSPCKLIDVVCQSALDDIGGSDLVAEYKERYGQSK